jgi:hypothetical protein
MHDPEQEAGKHQAERSLRINARPANIRGIEPGHLLAQPPEIENPVDAGENMIIGNEVSERSADKELKLPSLVRTQHPPFPAARLHAMQSAASDFFNGPAVQRCRYMTLESVAAIGDDANVSLPQLAG